MEFSEYLESLFSFKVTSCISCDFNFHLDVSDDVDTYKFIDLLDSMCITQYGLRWLLLKRRANRS